MAESVTIYEQFRFAPLGRGTGMAVPCEDGMKIQHNYFFAPDLF